MIQTLVLANSVHRPPSRISTKILSLSLFHKFFEIMPVVFNTHCYFRTLLCRLLVEVGIGALSQK